MAIAAGVILGIMSYTFAAALVIGLCERRWKNSIRDFPPAYVFWPVVAVVAVACIIFERAVGRKIGEV